MKIYVQDAPIKEIHVIALYSRLSLAGLLSTLSMHSNILIWLSCHFEFMMSTQPALAAHATAYHNYGLKEVLFGWAAENFTILCFFGIELKLHVALALLRGE